MGSLVAELAEKLSSATNNLDFDEQTMFLNTSADTVGIGTNNPASKLDVRGTMQVGVDATGYDVKLFGSSSGAYVEYDVSTNELEIRGPAATRGKLLLSTAETTVVDGNKLGQIDFQAPLDSAGTDAILVGASIWAEADATFSSSVNSTELVFATAASETAAEKMRITSGGNVGINVSTPGALHGSHTGGGTTGILEVRGTGSDHGILTLAKSTTTNDDEVGVLIFCNPDNSNGSAGQRPAVSGIVGSIYTDDSNAGDDSGGNLEFWTKPLTSGEWTEKMRILHDGKVGIGTTSPAVKFHVLGSGTALTHAGQTAQDVLIEGPTSAISGSSPQLSVVSNSTVAADAGGVLGFGAKYATDNWKYLAMIKGAGTGGGSPDGYLSFGAWKHTGSDFSEAMRIVAGGNVGIGTSAPASLLDVQGTVQVGGIPDAIGGFAPNVQIEGTGATTSALSIFRNSADESSPYLIMGKSRNASVGGDTIIADNDICGSIVWAAADGVDRVSRIAEIRGVINGTPGANDTPGSLEFLTTADGAQACTAAMEIDALGRVNVRGNITAGINPAGGDLDENSQISVYSYVNGDTANRTALYRSIQNVSGTGSGGTVAQIQSHQALGTTPYASGFSFKLYYPWSYHERFRFRGDGNAYAKVAFGSDTGLDFAELFEWEDGNSEEEYRAGYSVVMVSDGKIRKSTNDDNADDIIGVVSERAGFIGNSAWESWAKKYQTDDFGKKLTEKEEAWYWQEVDEDGKKGEWHQYGKNHVPADVTIPDDAVTLDEADVEILNPSYNESLEEGYVPREERPEWGIIGLLGQVPVRKGQKLGTRWLKIKNISSDVEEYLLR